MLKRHQTLLSNAHDFLVNEIPMDATLDAIRQKKILTWHDFEQMKTLRHQGRRAIARYFLAVLPHRGSQAFQAFLESLQEANAQHLVDLLLQQAGAVNLEALLKADRENEDQNETSHNRPVKTPTDTPLPQGPDPHEYAIKLLRNARFIREFVDPTVISPLLVQNKVITAREADMVVHLNGRNKKWDLILAALLQRGERAYQAFMAALLQNDYSTVFHTIQETTTEPSGSDDDSSFGGGRVTDDNFESDEEIKEEANRLRKGNSISDSLLRESLTKDSVRAESKDLLKRSHDLNNVNKHGSDKISNKNEYRTSSHDYDNVSVNSHKSSNNQYKNDSVESSDSDSSKNGALRQNNLGKNHNSNLKSVNEIGSY